MHKFSCELIVLTEKNGWVSHYLSDSDCRIMTNEISFYNSVFEPDLVFCDRGNIHYSSQRMFFYHFCN